MSNNLRYYNPETGKIDTHAKNLNLKQEIALKDELHDLKRIGGNEILAVTTNNTKEVFTEKVSGMNSSRENTKLALTNVSMTPYEQGLIALKSHQIIPVQTVLHTPYRLAA